MKSKLIVILLLSMFCATFFTNNVNASDTEIGDLLYCEVSKNLLDNQSLEAVNILLKNGYDEYDLANLSINLIKELAIDVERDPSSVEIHTQVQVISNIESLELAVNLDEEELVTQCKITSDEAKKIKKEICDMQEMPSSELQDKYDLSNGELVIIEDILEPKEDYKPYKKTNEKLTLSSTINSSYLTFTEAVTNQSTKKHLNIR